MIDRKRQAGSVVLALALAGGVTVAGEARQTRERNWPAWRGPLATGVAPHADPPLEWSESRNVRWKVGLPGRGLSTPLVWGDLVFVTAAVPVPAPQGVAKPQEVEAPPAERGVAPTHVLDFVLLALDRTNGQVRWRRTLRTVKPHEGTHTDGSWASASPVTDGEHVIAHFGSNGTYAVKMDGTPVWERDLGDMNIKRGFGEGSSPALHGDTVIVNWDHEGASFIEALNKKTGKTLWKTGREEATSWATPIVVEVEGRPQVVVSATGRTRGYDLATGKVVWEAGGMTSNAIPSPVHADGRVFVTSGFRGNALQAIDLGRAKGDVTATGAIVWQFDRDTPYVPSPLLYGNRLYFLKGNQSILSCLDTRTGKVHYGPQRLDGLEGVYASPVGAGGRVYITGRNGTTVVLKHADEFEVLAQNTLEDGLDASPAVAGNELFLRGHGSLYCLAAPPRAAMMTGPLGPDPSRRTAR